MFNKAKNIFFFIFFFTFIFILFKHYFSESNIIFTNKSRSSYSIDLGEKMKNLPILKNDTNNIIVYKEIKKRKKRFWEDIISNND